MAIDREVGVASFVTPRLSICTQLARGRLLGHTRPRRKVFVTRDPGIVRQTLSTKYVPISLLVRAGRIRKRTGRVVREYKSVPICATRFSILAGLANFTLAEKTLYTVCQPGLRRPRRVYTGTEHVTMLRGIMGPAGINTVFHSTTTLRVSTILLAPKYDSPLCQHTVQIDVKAMFRVP